MKTKRWRQWLGGLMACLLLAALLPTAAFARGLIDTSEPASLTIQYPCRGAAFRLYRVAEVSAYGEYTLTGDFKDYPVTLEQPDQAGWRALASTLAGYAARDELQPLAEGETDENGRLTFSGLEPGLYLVTGEKHTAGGVTYTPEPFLVSLPGLDEGDNWVYDVTVAPKYEQEKEPGGGTDGGTVRRKVLKVWEDDGAEERPESVTVQLLRNGEVYDTVTLSGENGWSHTWNGLDEDDTWQVVEDGVPEGYTVTVTREGITFVVTNTRQEDNPDEPNPGEPNPGEPDPGVDIPDNPPPTGPALPQTGTLWWPVPLLACGGMALFLTGWVRRRSGDSDEG